MPKALLAVFFILLVVIGLTFAFSSPSLLPRVAQSLASFWRSLGVAFQNLGPSPLARAPRLAQTQAPRAGAQETDEALFTNREWEKVEEI